MGLCFHSNSRLMVEFTFLVRGYIMHKKYLFSLVAFCSFAVFQSYFIKARVIGKGPDYISRIQRFLWLQSIWNTVVFECWNSALYLDESLLQFYTFNSIALEPNCGLPYIILSVKLLTDIFLLCHEIWNLLHMCKPSHQQST